MHVHTMFNMEHSALCLVIVAAWTGGGRTDACVCMAESLRCSADAVTALSIGYAPK